MKSEKQGTATIAPSSYMYVDLQGSDIVYDTFLRPMVMQYEPNIEQRLLHLRARSGQLLTFYIQNFADKGTAFFMDVLRSVVSDEPAPSVSEVTIEVITPSTQTLTIEVITPSSQISFIVLDLNYFPFLISCSAPHPMPQPQNPVPIKPPPLQICCNSNYRQTKLLGN